MYGQPPQGPPAPEPQKKNKGWLWGCLGCSGLLVLLLLVGGCMAALSGGDSDDTADGGGSGDSGSGDGGQEDEVAGIGETVESGAFAFTVTDVETGVQQVGDNPYLTEEPQGQYVIVHVTVENIGDEAGTFDSSSQTLTDADGNEYSADSQAEVAMESESFLNEINPGNTVEGQLVYDMPTGVEPATIELQDFLSLDSHAEVDLS